MFDLDRLAEFDRALATLPQSEMPVARKRPARPARPERLSCGMMESIGAQPLCPFVRTEAAA